MKVFYTFGSDSRFPFCGGWVEIDADNMKQAHAIFRACYPDREPGILNCSDYYTEAQFKDSDMLSAGEGKFTKEKQIEAFNKAKDKTLEILGDAAVNALGEIYGDFDTWVETKIEQVCRDLKRPDTGEAATTAATTAAATAASVATTIAATTVQQLAGEAPTTESTVEVEIEEGTGKE